MQTEPDYLRAWALPPPGSERQTTNMPRRTAVGDVDAAGAATLDLGKPPEGFHWKVERGAFVVPGLAGGTVLWLVFVGRVQDDQIEDSATIDVGAAATTTRAVGEWSPRIHVPSLTSLLVTVAGADPAGQAIVTVRVEERPN